MRFAKVISSKLENNQVVLQVEAIDGEIEVIYCNANNSFTLPQKNTVVLLQETSQKNKFVSHSSQNDFSHFKDLTDGELCVYAIDNNEVKSNIKFKKAGNKIIINDGADFLVSWNNLNKTLQQMQTAITDLYNFMSSHKHLGGVINGFTGALSIDDASLVNVKKPAFKPNENFKIENIQVKQE